MDGQWIGGFTGSTEGEILLNVDDRGSHFQGVAYLRYKDENIPWTGAAFQTKDKSAEFDFRASQLAALDRNSSKILTSEECRGLYPNVALAAYADVAGRWDDYSLTLKWQTDLGTEGSCDLFRSQANQASNLNAIQMSWADFKLHVSELARNRHLFRGQHEPWRLRTAFHRTGRADAIRFVNEDIQVLHRHLSVRTKHIFNLANSHENGAFFNLVQHHGYPTPLLDWTFSPYVAAFFAYRGARSAEGANADPNRRVRVFILDEKWRQQIPQILFLDRPFPHFSIAEFIAIENERMVPQQSVSAITNVDDIETYIQDMERLKGQTYLTAIDLPVAERADVIRELAYMGVTAGSLFPGLDGACEELKERRFR